TPQGLGLSGGEAPQLAAPPTTTSGARLACPNCNGALELRVPDQSLRVACPWCDHLVSVEGGTLAIIAKQARKPTIAIPLGSKATFSEGEMTAVGHVARSAFDDGDWYPFEEYLLHAPAVGFRWLVASDGHWSYVQPVAIGAISQQGSVRYDRVTFEHFQRAQLRVDHVLGELYWRVQVGEKVDSDDHIAPPAMLSREANAQEENWSLSTYLTVAEVERAFGKPLGIPRPIGVAPNQPYPAGIPGATALVMAAFFAVGLGKCASAPDEQKLAATFRVPAQERTVPARDVPVSAVLAADTTEPTSAVMFSDKFELAGGRNIDFALEADVRDNWLFAALDLVNDQTGSVVSFEKAIEYYSGVDSDGSWTEGSRTAHEVIGPVERGVYLLRIEGQHGGAAPIELGVVVRQGVFRWLWFGIAFGVLLLPFGLVALHAHSFRKRRWEHSNAGSHGRDYHGEDDDDDDD
ncbi:MAG: DUF4178 domain-containing protein, partial [Myxococcales bacterium]|nr:DUF4178 domain-containing protein [Myxococcales bacterium]